MKTYAWIAAAAMALAASPAEGRLFRQTFGATVPQGSDCAWNLNQDYFVPRHCDSCRYDLFSHCKTSHTRSPACKYLHQVYCGYCTPYGPCHYRWRDHVYKKHCGCTPLGCSLGPWHGEKCSRTCFALKHGSCAHGCSGPDACGELGDAGYCEPDATCALDASEEFFPAFELPNVEPMGGEILGSVAALPGGAMGAPGAVPMPTVGGVAIPGATNRTPLPGLGGLPAAGGTLPLGY